jgi:hypothetical protein
MDGLMLRDEAARDRVRQAEEFLDPRAYLLYCKQESLGSPADCRPQMTKMCEATGPTLS